MLRAYVAARGWTPNCYAAQLQLFRPHPEAGYDLTPGFRLKSGTFDIAINSLGLRGPEVARAKPPGTRRIVLFGESAAFGYFVSDGEEAARLLELDLRNRGCAVEVLNAAIPGYSMHHHVVRARDVLPLVGPDLVVLYAGHNDIPMLCSDAPRSLPWCTRGWERALGHSTLYGFLAYRMAPRQQRVHNAPTAPDRLTPAGMQYFKHELAAFAEEVRRSGARLVICTQAAAARDGVDAALRPHVGQTEEELTQRIATHVWLRDTLSAFAAENALPLIDVAAEIPPTSDMLADYIHLTAAGERRFAEVLARDLAPLLPDCAAAPAHVHN